MMFFSSTVLRKLMQVLLIAAAGSVIMARGNSFSRVALLDRYGYLATENSGLVVIDMIDMANPVQVGALDIGGPAQSVVVGGELAYVAGDTNGMKIVDVSNPEAPVLVATYDTPGSAQGLSVHGKYAYVADGNGGLQIVDVSDPRNPSLAGTYEGDGFATRVTVLGSTAYLGTMTGGVQLINVTVPQSPVMVSRIESEGEVVAISAAGPYGFLALEEGRLEIINLADRARPVRMGVHAASGKVFGLNVAGDEAILATDQGLEMVDVTNKNAPALKGFLPLRRLASGPEITFVRPAPPEAEDIILDCDPGNDVDDMGDLAVLHALADQGELNILGVMYSMRPGFGAPVIEVANRFYGRPTIPIGVSKTSTWDARDWYGSFLQTNFYNTIADSTNAPDAVDLYRNILSKRPDHSVNIVIAGQLRNIYGLWHSEAGDPQLSGKQLLKQKVKRLIVVAGIFPSGHEFNLYADPVSATVLHEITNTIPISYMGIELGNDVLIGTTIRSKPETDPIRAAYDRYFTIMQINSRPAWTGLALLFAARGYGTVETPLFNGIKGYIQVNNESGYNIWLDNAESNQEYLRFNQPVSYYTSLLDDLLMRPPMKGGTVYAIMPDQYEGLQIADVTAPENPTRVSELINPTIPRIQTISNAETIALRWPALLTEYSLEHKATLSGSWEPVVTGTISGDGYLSWTTNSSDTSRFYRLKKKQE